MPSSSLKVVKSIIFIPLFCLVLLFFALCRLLKLLLSVNIVNTLRVPFRFGSLGLSGRKLQLTCDDHYESIQFSPEVTLLLLLLLLLLLHLKSFVEFFTPFFLFCVSLSPAGNVDKRFWGQVCLVHCFVETL